MIVVDDPGPLATVQDQGRPGMAAIGISPSGAFDRAAYDLANRLVGNTPAAAVIEALGGGLRLRCDRDLIMAVTGATGDVRVDGRILGRNAALRLKSDAVVELPAPTGGLRSYVAVRGGFAPPAVLGSRSWDSLGSLGPAPLRIGQWLPVGPATEPVPPIDHVPVSRAVAEPAVLTVTPGPRRDWFTDASWRHLTTTEWIVQPTSDRVGVRLGGPELQRTDDRASTELPPEGLVRGAIQVPPDGRPIILGPDHPTTGGYPVIAVVNPAGVSRCAQLVPGESVRLRAILFAGR